MQEIIEKLRENGYSELVECLLDNENDCYTKRGRLNKSATIRKLGWKSKQLEDALEAMRELLQKEFQTEA
jgi:23S rRNA maturation mini-RNase III